MKCCFCFLRIFPNLTKIIYLDVDTIVAHDVWELWKEVVSTDRLLVEIPRLNCADLFNYVSVGKEHVYPIFSV